MLKVAIISCGMIATNAHIPAYLDKKEYYEIAAVCDVNAELAEKTAKDFGIPNFYTDAKEMLIAEKPDVVSVCVPNLLHKKFTMLALQYGANVLCEKPLAFTYADAKEMFDYAKAQGKKLMACQSLRFLPERLAAMDMVKKGELGDIYYAELSRIRRRGIPTWGKFHLKSFSGGGAFTDIGVHGIDSLVWLMNNPKVASVKACMNKVHADEAGSAKASGALKGGVDTSKFNHEEMDVESFSSGYVNFENGAALSFKVSWAANLKDENNIVLAGKKCGLDIENGKIYSGEDCIEDTTVSPNGFKDEAFFGHFCLIDNFAKALLGQEELFVKPEETLNVTAIVEAAYLSAELGREVKISEVIK